MRADRLAVPAQLLKELIRVGFRADLVGEGGDAEIHTLILSENRGFVKSHVTENSQRRGHGPQDRRRPGWLAGDRAELRLGSELKATVVAHGSICPAVRAFPASSSVR